MKGTIFFVLIVIVQNSNSESFFEVVEKFIKSSDRSSISFISTTTSFINSSEVIKKYSSMPKFIFTIANEMFNNCNNYANTDFYDDEISAKAVHQKRHNTTLFGILKQMEFNDFIFFTSFNFIEVILKCVVQPLSRYLIIITAKNSTPSISKISNMLNTTWITNGVFKVFILSDDKIFHFNPFHQNNDGSFGKLNNSIMISFETKLENLNGYPLRVELFSSTYTIASTKKPMNVDDFFGPDADVAKVTRELLNSTMLLVKNDGSKFGFRNANGTFTGALKTLRERTCDVAFVTFFIKDYETRNVEFSAPVYSDDVCLIVKKAGKIPQFILPLITFDDSLWISLVLFSLLGITFWSFLRIVNNYIYPTVKLKQIKFNLPTHIERLPIAIQYVQICIDTFILFLNAPLRRFPQVQSERIFTGAICLLSLNIVSMFQSGLATCYVKPMYYRNIDTLEQFADIQKNIIVKYPAMMTDIFPEDSSELFRKLYHRMVLVQNVNLTASQVTNRLNMAGVARKTTLKIQKEEGDVHLIPECPRSYHLSYVYTKHWVLGERVNKIILDLKQAGLIGKWIEDVNFRIKLETAKIQTTNVHHRMLRIDDLALAFMILLSGCVIGFILLFIEIYRMKRCVKRFSYLP